MNMNIAARIADRYLRAPAAGGSEPVPLQSVQLMQVRLWIITRIAKEALAELGDCPDDAKVVGLINEVLNFSDWDILRTRPRRLASLHEAKVPALLKEIHQLRRLRVN
jgi:hypothetical protein